MSNINLEELEVNGIKYVPKVSEKERQPDGPIKIVVLQRGWVLVGRLEEIGTLRKLHNASVIRNFGTTKGLGQIAKDGPTSSTKLDKCNGVVEFDILTMVLSISVEEQKWINEL